MEHLLVFVYDLRRHQIYLRPTTVAGQGRWLFSLDAVLTIRGRVIKWPQSTGDERDSSKGRINHLLPLGVETTATDRRSKRALPGAHFIIPDEGASVGSSSGPE